jgi:hypothetical protein
MTVGSESGKGQELTRYAPSAAKNEAAAGFDETTVVSMTSIVVATPRDRE